MCDNITRGSINLKLYCSSEIMSFVLLFFIRCKKLIVFLFFLFTLLYYLMIDLIYLWLKKQSIRDFIDIASYDLIDKTK